MSGSSAPLLSVVAMTALSSSGCSPARGTAHASIEPLSCSLLIRAGTPPASGLVPLTNVAWLSCAVREPTNFFPEVSQKLLPVKERVGDKSNQTNPDDHEKPTTCLVNEHATCSS